MGLTGSCGSSIAQRNLFCRFGSAVLALSLPKLLPTPSFLDSGGGFSDSLHAVGAVLCSS